MVGYVTFLTLKSVPRNFRCGRGGTTRDTLGAAVENNYQNENKMSFYDTNFRTSLFICCGFSSNTPTTVDSRGYWRVSPDGVDGEGACSCRSAIGARCGTVDESPEAQWRD